MELQIPEELRPEELDTPEPVHREAKEEPLAPAQLIPAPRPVSAFGKAMGVLRTVVPLAQKLLPLLDGQVGTAVSNLIGPQVTPRQMAQALGQLQDGLAQLEQQHVELRTHVAGQTAALKAIDAQIEEVRQLAEETASAQRAANESLQRMSRKVNLMAIAGLLLLAGVVALNVILFVSIRRVLR